MLLGLVLLGLVACTGPSPCLPASLSYLYTIVCFLYLGLCLEADLFTWLSFPLNWDLFS